MDHQCIRIGTPAMTTRGMGTEEALMLVQLIDDVIKNHEDEGMLKAINKKVTVLCRQFPDTKSSQKQ